MMGLGWVTSGMLLVCGLGLVATALWLDIMAERGSPKATALCFRAARWLLVGAGAIIVILIFAPERAAAHDAASGWSYPFSCCSGYDCREVAATAIKERPEGFVIVGTGEVVGHQDTRLRNSPDGEFHWCSVAGKDDGRTICLFVPPRSY